MKESYLSVKKPAESEIVIEKSRFICSVSPVNGEEDAKNFVSEVKAKHKTATHNCYAFIADENGLSIKFSDDGEPQGTAGMPMLEVLKNKKLFCTAVVVTRYFGGVKLGAGGLVRAYSDCTAKGVEKCGIVENIYSNTVSVDVGFSIYPKVQKYFYGITCNLVNTDYKADGITITFEIPESLLEKVKKDFADMTSGKAELKVIASGFSLFGEKR
jgi:uncharacterized YigZ family protein